MHDDDEEEDEEEAEESDDNDDDASAQAVGSYRLRQLENNSDCKIRITPSQVSSTGYMLHINGQSEEDVSSTFWAICDFLEDVVVMSWLSWRGHANRHEL